MTRRFLMFFKKNSNSNDTDCRSAVKYIGYTMMGLSAVMSIITCATMDGPECTSSFFRGPNCRMTVVMLMCEGIFFSIGAIANLGSRVTCERNLPEEEDPEVVLEDLESTGSDPEEKHAPDDEIEYEANEVVSDDLKTSLLNKFSINS